MLVSVENLEMGEKMKKVIKPLGETTNEKS
jgi:hypothetical protein